MGKRLLRSYVTKPLLNIAAITLRQNAVEELCSNTILRGEAIEALGSVRDIERIMAKVVYATANAKDLFALAQTSVKFPYLKSLLAETNCKKLKEIYTDIDPLEDISSLILDAIDPEAPTTLKDGGIIKKGYNSQLDMLRGDVNGSADILADIEVRERERTGIKNLKVRHNKVFGYYIEVTNSFLDKVPEDYIRKQTLTGCERFLTEELKNIERRLFSAKEKGGSIYLVPPYSIGEYIA
jgi:DNA mismatch repair protein MutS